MIVILVYRKVRIETNVWKYNLIMKRLKSNYHIEEESKWSQAIYFNAYMIQ